MRDQFWNLFVEIKIKEQYYRLYREQSEKYDSIISGFLFFTSASSISAWVIWQKLPLLWSLIIAAAQVLSILKPSFLYSKRKIALKFLMQDMSALLSDIEKDWLHIVNGDESLISVKRTSQYSNRCKDLESRFADDLRLPHNFDFLDKAQEEAIAYFCYRFHISKKEIEYL